MEQKSLRGFKALRLHGQAALRRPLIQQRAHIGGVGRAVIADGNAYRHTFLSFIARFMKKSPAAAARPGMIAKGAF